MPHLLYQVLAGAGVFALIVSINGWLCRHVPRYGAWMASRPDW